MEKQAFGGGRYMVVFNSGVRVRFDAEIIPSRDTPSLLLFRGEQQIGSIDSTQVAGMFDMRAIEGGDEKDIPF